MTTAVASPVSTLPRMVPGERCELAAIPALTPAAFRAAVVDAVNGGARISALFGRTLARPGQVGLVAVLAHDFEGVVALAASADVGESYESITADCPQAHWFEREIAEQWGVRPRGHPWLKPIRFHAPGPSGKNLFAAGTAAPAPSVTDFFRMAGEESHEVAVGPVHAGVIEPGHFRFQCHGEIVHHLEISLGYQHRGVERALVAGPPARGWHYAEALAGDTTIGHATAHCRVLEGLAGTAIPPRAEGWRALALELERLANHTGDLGALAGDVGYLPTASYCGRLRGDFLNLTALVCGSRFGRGMVRLGGVGFDLDAGRRVAARARLEEALRDVGGAVSLLWATPSVLARFEDTGRLDRKTAAEIGLVGPAARACDLARDTRRDFAWGVYRTAARVAPAVWPSGDVFARAYVRWLEIQQSVDMARNLVDRPPDGPVRTACGDPAPSSIAVALVEGWRGEICHVGITDPHGRWSSYKVVDPSFHNWFGLALALRGQQISDFPLCNKSFNLSYCGHDL